MKVLFLSFIICLFLVPTVTAQTLIDDFEDGNYSDNLGGTWSAQNDAGDGGNSTASVSLITNSSVYIHFTYSLGANYQYRYALVGDNYSPSKNFVASSGIKFKIRGSGKKCRVVVATTNISDYDSYGYVIESTPGAWTTYSLTWGEFSQEGWGASKPFDLSGVSSISFKASSQITGESGWFDIDDISLLPPPTPIITSFSPQDSERDVSTTAKITVVFNVEMDKASVTNNFTISPSVTGTFVWPDSQTVSFIPSSTLPYNSTYTCLITTNAKSAQNVKLDKNYRWVFTTIAQSKGDNIFQNGPNPFVLSKDIYTYLYYSLSEDSIISIKIYNINGQLVKRVVNNETRIKGYHTQDRWDGKNEEGLTVNSGIYICMIEAPTFKKWIKIVVVK